MSLVAHLRYVNEQEGTDITLAKAMRKLAEVDLLPNVDASSLRKTALWLCEVSEGVLSFLYRVCPWTV